MKNRDPFKYFKTSREVIRLAVMLYVRFPLSLRIVEDPSRFYCRWGSKMLAALMNSTR
jgi:hypothetical protein